MSVMDNLREIRETHAMSVEDLSQATGISASYLRHLENGTRRNPSFEVLQRICQELEIPLDRLVR